MANEIQFQMRDSSSGNYHGTVVAKVVPDTDTRKQLIAAATQMIDVFLSNRQGNLSLVDMRPPVARQSPPNQAGSNILCTCKHPINKHADEGCFWYGRLDLNACPCQKFVASE